MVVSTYTTGFIPGCYRAPASATSNPGGASCFPFTRPRRAVIIPEGKEHGQINNGTQLFPAAHTAPRPHGKGLCAATMGPVSIRPPDAAGSRAAAVHGNRM